MMIGSRQASYCLQDRTNVVRNQNVPYSPNSSRKVVVSPVNFVQPHIQPSHLHLHQQPQPQPYSRILQNQPWNPNNRPISPRGITPSSPRRLVEPEHMRHRVIELGGSRDKSRRRSRQRSGSNYSHEGGMTQDFSFQSEAVRTQDWNATQPWKRKAAMLQNRVKELHAEKQSMAINFNNRIADLEHENRRLVNRLRDYEDNYRTQRSRSRSNQSQRSVRNRSLNRKEFGTSYSQYDGFGRSTVSNSQEFRREGDFNVQDMLANQIEINLELREQVDKYCEQINQLRVRDEQNSIEIIKYKDENADLKLQVFQLQEKSSELPNNYNEQFYNNEEKQKRIAELEQQVYNLTNQLAEKDQYLRNSEREMSSLKMSRMNESQRNENLKNRVEELERGSQSGKYKEMMQTIFRLNAQLNARK